MMDMFCICFKGEFDLTAGVSPLADESLVAVSFLRLELMLPQLTEP